jgi:hypothetical protein
MHSPYVTISGHPSSNSLFTPAQLYDCDDNIVTEDVGQSSVRIARTARIERATSAP